MRERVLPKLEPLVDAQIDAAIGVRHFFLRDPKTGRFQRVTDPDRIDEALNADVEGSYYYVYTKDPSIQAFTDLMNRVIDKPTEQVDVAVTHGDEEIVAALKAARLRVARMRRPAVCLPETDRPDLQSASSSDF